MKVIATMDNGEIDLKESYITIYNEEDRKYFDYEGNELSNKEAKGNQNLYANKKNDKWGFVDNNGSLKVECIYEMVTEFNIYGYAGIKKDGKWGVVNTEGKIILEPRYQIEDGFMPHFIGEYYTLEQGNNSIYIGM